MKVQVLEQMRVWIKDIDSISNNKNIIYYKNQNKIIIKKLVLHHQIKHIQEIILKEIIYKHHHLILQIIKMYH